MIGNKIENVYESKLRGQFKSVFRIRITLTYNHIV